MGYIKKLKSNELVGGTDKHTIYPVTSTEAVFEEITNGNESSFKSQKTINKEQQDELDDHEERIQAAEAEDIKSITINGSTKEFRVDDRNNVDLTIYTVDNDPEMPGIASNVEDLRNMVGTSTPVLETSHKTRIETLEGGESVTGSVENKIKTKVDSINSSYQDDNNEYVKYSMTQTSGEVTNFNIDETSLKNAITSLNTSISGDNIVIRQGSTPSGTGEAGKIYRYVNSSNNTYTDYMYSGGSWVPLATHDTSNEQAQVAYYTCTATGSGAQATKQFVGNGSLTYTPSSGGHIKILMGEANTATGTIYLQFGTTTSTKKPLYYDGEPASVDNTWGKGETIAVYYDPSANSNAGAYFATNAQGGGGFVKDGSMGIDLDITDDSEHVLARFSGGHIMTKNFDSSKVNIKTGDDSSADLDIEDENGKVLARFSGGHIMTKYFDSASKAERPSSGYEVFSYMVDTTIPTRRTSGTTVQDGENLQADKGIVMLPESYTSNGNPTRLVMFAHGLGGLITSSSTSFSQSFPLHQALLADGYAIFEINGTPGVENTSYSHFGGPVWVRSCIAAYKYLISKYNFRTDGILTYGYSLGGLGTLQLPNFNLPVIAQVTYAGVYDQFKSSYSKDTAAGKADFLARFGMTDYSFTLTNGGNNVVPPQQEREYIIEHRDMWARYADLAYGVTTPDIARMYSVWPAPSTTQDADEEAIYDGLVINNRPPCLFIQGEADTTIVKRYTTYLATMIGNSGKVADVRFFTGGTHQNILTIGDNVSYTAANGQTLTLNASSYEGLLFLKRFNH